MSNCAEKHPELIKPHLKTIIAYLKKPCIHNAIKRNTIRLLQFIEIPKKYQGEVADLCFAYLQNKKEPVAIKAFCITVLDKIITQEPDLKKELIIMLEDQLPFASPAFLSRANKILKNK